MRFVFHVMQHCGFPIRIFSSIVLLSASHPAIANDQNFYTPRHQIFTNESDLVIPVVSFFLPGAGQWFAGQYEYAAAYTGVAALGVAYSLANTRDLDNDDKSGSDDLETKGVAERKILLGLQTYRAAGGFSLFHSFRTAVQIRQQKGQYDFLDNKESPSDVALAPFQFSYALRPSTYIPLIIGAAVNLWATRVPPSDYDRDHFRTSDAAFAAGFSYNAGTHEEAIFRGALMPLLHEYGMGEGWANGIQAAAFAAAHLGSTPFPIIQFGLGWHFGRITQRNRWEIGEAVFIHTWWDVMAFTAQYHIRKRDPQKNAPAQLHLPPVTFVF